MLNYTEAKLVYLLRNEFGCTYSRVREIMLELYPWHKFAAHTGKDIVGYAYILLGKKIESDLDECESKSLTAKLLEDVAGDSYEE